MNGVSLKTMRKIIINNNQDSKYVSNSIRTAKYNL